MNPCGFGDAQALWEPARGSPRSVAVAAAGSDLARGPGAARGRWQQSPRRGPGLVPQPFLPSLQPLCRLRAGTSGVNALRKHKADPRHISAAIFSAPLLTNKLLLAGDGEASSAAGAPRRAPAPCRASWPALLSPRHGARRMLNPPHLPGPPNRSWVTQIQQHHPCNTQRGESQLGAPQPGGQHRGAQPRPPQNQSPAPDPPPSPEQGLLPRPGLSAAPSLSLAPCQTQSGCFETAIQ